MQIDLLELKNYRNYEKLSVNFDPGVNIIYGENAQGKTNILESIYMCCSGKSHKGSKEREIIKHEKDEAHVKAYMETLFKCSTRGMKLAACPLAFGEVGVKARIQSVFHYKKPAFWVLLVGVVGLMFSLRNCGKEQTQVIGNNRIDQASGGDTIDVAIEYSPLSYYTYGDTTGGFYFELINLMSE